MPDKENILRKISYEIDVFEKCMREASSNKKREFFKGYRNGLECAKHMIEDEEMYG